MKRSLQLAVLLAFVTFAPAPSRAHPGTGIVVDRGGRIFFTNLKEIWRLNPDGRLSIAVPNKHSHALYLDAQQVVWGEHLTYESRGERWWSSAWNLKPDGTYSEVVPPTLGFPKIFSTAVDRHGNRYFAEVNNHEPKISRIVRMTPAGRLEFVAGGAQGHSDGKGGAARFGSVYAMTLGPEGLLYLTDGPWVRKVSPEGVVSTLARASGARRGSLISRALGGGLMGLAVDAGGNIFAADSGGKRVVRFSRGGEVRTLAKSGGPWSPTGVALDGRFILSLEYELRLLKAFRGRVRVRRIFPDGKVTTLAVIE